jgi:hypothetical protein
MDPQSAAKLVSALDAELGRRWRKRRDSAQAQSRAEAEADPALVAAQDALERAQSAMAAAQADVDEADEEDAAEAEERLTAAEAALAAAQRGLSAARSSLQVWRSVLVLARSLDWHADHPPPVGAITEPVDQAAQDERERVRAWCDERGGLDSVLREIVRRAERLCDRAEAEADPSIPKHRAVIIGPRHQSISGLASDPAAGSAKAKTVDGNGKSAKMSRTDKWREQQAAEAAARQALLPLRPAQPAQQEIGWHRGIVQSFDQRLALGVVRFSGAAGFTEAALAPAAFRASGLTVLIPNQQVDCRLVKQLDGSVIVEDVRLASGANPDASEAAAQERFQMQLDRNKWMR